MIKYIAPTIYTAANLASPIQLHNNPQFYTQPCPWTKPVEVEQPEAKLTQPCQFLHQHVKSTNPVNRSC